MTRLIALILVLATTTASASTKQSLRPGGMATLDIGATSDPVPSATIDGKQLLVLQQDGRWVAVVGIPLDTQPGELHVYIDGTQESIAVAPHAYREQRLTVQNQSYVSPDPAQLERIAGERKIIDAALTSFRPIPITDISLAAPVAGPQSSSFGLRRFFNEQPRSPHKGMDIAAPQGEAVQAPSNGLVAVTGNFFFNGNTIIIDHGQGFVTMYCHLSEISVREGQSLVAGEEIGAIGATGRVTGPHLHFGTYLNGTAIDPAILIQP